MRGKIKMAREYHDLLTRNSECVEFGKKLGYEEVHYEDVNYIKKNLKIDETKLNIVKGGDIKRNRQAVNKKGVDVLLDPVGPKEKGFDTAMTTVAKEKEVAIGISLKKIMKYRGMKKVRYFRSLDYLGKLLKKGNCNIVIVSGAKEKLDMRPPKQLSSLGYLLGLDEEESFDTVSKNVKEVIKRSR